MQDLPVKQKYRGVIVPMVTPLDEGGDVDAKAVRVLVDTLVREGCAPFVAGTTGEAPSLTEEGRVELVRAAAAATDGRAPVYAGIADNCLAGCLRRARLYRDLGADVAVCHLPGYYPIDEAEMAVWYRALADACPLPLMLYNIPATTGLSLPLRLVDELSRHENVVGVKDSERGDERLREALALWRDREDFTFHLGWAAKSAFGLLNGLDGIVPSSGNLVPGLYRRMVERAGAGDAAEAGRLQALTDDISACYQEGRSLSRSIPVLKAMLSAFGLCGPAVAPPMMAVAGGELAAIVAEARTRWAPHVRPIEG